MDIKEEKREYNNELFRYYAGSVTDKRKYLIKLINYNHDLVGYAIFKYFPKKKYRHDIYEIGIAALVLAIENYDMCMECDFEDYLLSNIINAIERYIFSEKTNFITSKEQYINLGDIYYNEYHNTKDTLDTKKLRDSATDKEYKKILKNSDKTVS